MIDLAQAELLGREARDEGLTRHNNPFHILREAKLHEAWERGRLTKRTLADLQARRPADVAAAKAARQRRADWLAGIETGTAETVKQGSVPKG